MTRPTRVLTHIVCGAGPASEARQLTKLAQQRGWTVQMVATPAALDFLDLPALEAQTSSPIRSHYRKPGEPRSHPADAIIVAPATYNTINKWANGISDTYALGILAETTGLGVPTVVLPFVNTALASRQPFRRSIESLPNRKNSTRQPLLALVLLWTITAFLLFFVGADQRSYTAMVTSPHPLAKVVGGGVTKSSTASWPIALSTLWLISWRCTARRSCASSA
jgi:hypothetical protein